MSQADAIMTALATAGIPAYDTQTEHPEPQYAVITAGVGTATPHRLSTTAHWADEIISIMCVGRTPAGARSLAQRVRAALTGKRIPDGAPPLRELESSQPLADPDGGIGDTRYALTIRYRQPTPTHL